MASQSVREDESGRDVLQREQGFPRERIHPGSPETRQTDSCSGDSFFKHSLALPSKTAMRTQEWLRR